MENREKYRYKKSGWDIEIKKEWDKMGKYKEKQRKEEKGICRQGNRNPWECVRYHRTTELEMTE